MYKVVSPNGQSQVVFTGTFEACRAEAKRLSNRSPRLYRVEAA